MDSAQIVVASVCVWGVVLVYRLIGIAAGRAKGGAVKVLGGGRAPMTHDDGKGVVFGPVFGWRRLCRTCWVRKARHRGHIIPDSWGGQEANFNFIPQCARCNIGLGARIPRFGLLRWLTPWVGWRFPIPTPLIVASTIVALVLKAMM